VTAELKSSTMAVSVDAIIGLGAYAPPALHATAARLVSRGRWFNLVVSNIPAPQVPLYLGGAELEASYPAMPLGETCGLSIACTSLGGAMSFGLTADWDLVRDLDVLARGIDHGIEGLEAAASAKSR
jgi:diacylglycerol O-acyltransferase / wax synthase